MIKKIDLWNVELDYYWEEYLESLDYFENWKGR